MKRMTTGDGLLTAEDLLTGDLPERGELWDGRLLVRETSGGSHGRVNVRILVELERACLDGWVLDSSAGYVVSRSPDRVLSPDVSYVSRAHVPELPDRGFLEGAPDFAVEVRSPADSWIAVVERGGIWIAHGVGVVWCVDPFERRVAVLRPGEPPEVRTAGVVSARPVVPFDAEIEVLFRERKRPGAP